MSALSRLPLVLMLAFCAFAELLLYRLGVRLASPLDHTGDSLLAIVGGGGRFFYHLTGVLALAVFTWATVVLIRDRQLLRVPERMAYTVLSAMFLPLAATSLLVGLPSTMAPHLNTAFGLLLLALVVGFFRQPASLRAKLGVLYLAVPLLLHCYWMMTQQIPALAPAGAQAELPTRIFRTSELMMVVGAFAAFLFFAPSPSFSRLLTPAPLAVAVAATTAGLLFARTNYSAAQHLAYYGLGINLPPLGGEGLVYFAALFFFTFTVAALVRQPGNQRAVGLGLLLIGVSGFQLAQAYQYLLTLVGMMQVIRGSRRGEPAQARAQGAAGPAADQAPVPDDWKPYLKQLAEVCSQPAGSGEAVVLQTDDQQIAHVRGRRQGLPFTLRFLLMAGEVRQLEVTVGAATKDPAPLSFNRRRGSRGRKVKKHGDGRRVSPGPDSFGRQFVVHDATGDAATLVTEQATRENMLQLLHGWLGVWPGEGLRYLTYPPADGWPVPLAEVSFSASDADTADIEALLDLLLELASLAEVR
jgi:hypothetical protein